MVEWAGVESKARRVPAPAMDLGQRVPVSQMRMQFPIQDCMPLFPRLQVWDPVHAVKWMLTPQCSHEIQCVPTSQHDHLLYSHLCQRNEACTCGMYRLGLFFA